MADESREIWIVRDSESSVPSRAVSLSKLRRGVKIGKLRLDYEVAHVGTDHWMPLGALFEQNQKHTVVLTESSVVTSAPRHVTSAQTADRVLEAEARRTGESEAMTWTDRVSESDILSDPDMADVSVLSSEGEETGYGYGVEDPSEATTAVNAQVYSQPEPLAAPVVTESAVHAEARALTEVSHAGEPPTASVVVTPAPRASQASQVSHPSQVSPSQSARRSSPGIRASLQEGPQHVIVTDVRMPFGSMVIFMVKWALASIPALLLLTAIVGALGVLAVTVLAAVGIAVR